MTLTRLALNNISASAFRSWVIFLCVLVVAGFSLTITVITRGAESSLELASRRLGADIIVVPQGTEAAMEGALLMGLPTRIWMPRDIVTQVAAIPGVEVASPQMYLSTLSGASCCSVDEMFLLAYEPETDFTIQPWLISTIGRGLNLGEVVGGTYVFTPEGENIFIYGYIVTLIANLEPTGSGLDQSMFMTFDSAYDVARISYSRAEEPLEIPPDSVSAAMVRLSPGADLDQVADAITRAVPGVTAVKSPDLFLSYRQQTGSLLRGITLVMALTWVMAIVAVGLVFSIALNERRREIGMLRALGATRSFVLRSLLAEAGALGLLGALVGIPVALLGTFLFRNLLMSSLEVLFLFPSVTSILVLFIVGLVLAVATVTLAAFIPAYRVSRLDPATAMRD
ncbi:MAG: FtsX-like permease family protein [Anaerolineae bacterium]|mgnify:CR=1 FL=1|nr:FtsX-like permease family protein [Anaerolineae bacterium]